MRFYPAYWRQGGEGVAAQETAQECRLACMCGTIGSPPVSSQSFVPGSLRGSGEPRRGWPSRRREEREVSVAQGGPWGPREQGCMTPGGEEGTRPGHITKRPSRPWPTWRGTPHYLFALLASVSHSTVPRAVQTSAWPLPDPHHQLSSVGFLPRQLTWCSHGSEIHLLLLRVYSLSAKTLQGYDAKHLRVRPGVGPSTCPQRCGTRPGGRMGTNDG